MSEKLADKLNYVNDEGDVKPLDAIEEPATYSHYDPTEYPVRKVELSEMEPSYMIRKALAAQALYETEGALDHQADTAVAAEIEADPEIQEKTSLREERANRLVRARELNGFYPQEKSELSQVTALSSDTYAIGGAAKLLGEIQKFRIKIAPKSQSDTINKTQEDTSLLEEGLISSDEAKASDKKKYDPKAALRRIVRDWEGYVKSSRGDLSALLLLKEQMSDDAIEPFTALTNVSGVQDWKMQDITQRAIGAITRQYEIRQFAEQGAPEYLGTEYSTRNREVVARETEVVKNLRVREARQVVDSLITSHQARMDYWKMRIEEATHNYAVSEVAQDVLKDLS